jgi:hypothetical protein
MPLAGGVQASYTSSWRRRAGCYLLMHHHRRHKTISSLAWELLTCPQGLFISLPVYQAHACEVSDTR